MFAPESRTRQKLFILIAIAMGLLEVVSELFVRRDAREALVLVLPAEAQYLVGVAACRYKDCFPEGLAVLTCYGCFLAPIFDRLGGSAAGAVVADEENVLELPVCENATHPFEAFSSASLNEDR